MAAYEVRRDHIEPLWDRVDRNRWQLVVVVLLFALAATVVLTVSVYVLAALVLMLAIAGSAIGFAGVNGDSLLSLLGWLAAGCAAGVGVYVVRTLTRSERWFAERFGAKLTATGECLPTKMVLKDMAIAIGMDVAPALYVIETPNVNAFVYGRPGRRAIIGVTRGLTERLDVNEQRAVFANLMARLKSGDTIWASGITALMAPLWHVRTAQMTAPDDEMTYGLGTHARDRGAEEDSALLGAYEAGAAFSFVGLPLLAAASLFVVVSEFLAFGHMRTQSRHAETADAEGMLLLKDPASMLSTLEKAVRFNNFVPFAGPGMMQLFYVWSSDFSTDDEDDPANARISRLREVLGVAGMPTRAVPDEPRFELVPPAPRLGDAALLPGTRDPIRIGPLAWWIGILVMAVPALLAVNHFGASVRAIEPNLYSVSPAEWAVFLGELAHLQARMLVYVCAAVFVGGAISGRSWVGVLGGLFVYGWVVASAFMTPALQVQSGDSPGRFLIVALAAILAAGVTGGLAGGAIGRRLVRWRG